MTMEPVVESGMIFGPFPDGRCFYIEKSATYQKIQDGVRMAEFLLLHTAEGQLPTVWIVEAKSSTPRPETQPSFDEFIEEIREKLTNASVWDWRPALTVMKQPRRNYAMLSKRWTWPGQGSV